MKQMTDSDAPIRTAPHSRRGSAMVMVFVVALIAVACVFLLWEVTKTYDAKSAQQVKEANTIHAVSQVVDWLDTRRDNRFYFYVGTQDWALETDDKNGNEVADFNEGTVWSPATHDTNGNGIPDFGEPNVTPVQWGDSEVYCWSRLLEGDPAVPGHAKFQYICGARTWHRYPNYPNGTVGDTKTGYWVQEMADVRRKWDQFAAQIDAALMLEVNDTPKQADFVVDTTLNGTGSAGDKVSGLDHDLNGELTNEVVDSNDKYAISLNEGFSLNLTFSGGAEISGAPADTTDERPTAAEMLDAIISAVQAMTPNPIVPDAQGLKIDNSDGAYGTEDEWKVTRIDATKGQSISMAAQDVGHGILLIEYDNLDQVDVKISGGAAWKGIILVVAKNSGTVDANGGLDISGSPGKDTRLLGATIVYAKNADGGGAGMDGAVKISGTPTVQYSSEAVAKALQPIPPIDKMNFRLLTASEAHPSRIDRGNMTADLKMDPDNGFIPLQQSSTSTSTTTTSNPTTTTTTDPTTTTTTDPTTTTTTTDPTTTTTTTDPTTTTTTGTTTTPPGKSGSSSGASKK